MNQDKKLLSVFILIRSLNVGGAERQVCILAQSLQKKGYKVTVGVFYARGVLEQKLRQAGVTIVALEKKGRWDLVGWFCRYLAIIRKANPDVIYSFLTVSNIIAITGRLFNNTPVVWGIRASNMNLEGFDWLARLSVGVEKILSRFVQTIIFNGQFSCRHHESLGYHLHNPVVIPNGIDTDTFKPDMNSRILTRTKLGIPQDAIVIGMLARVDPMKDYETYLTAARALSPHYENLYFIAAGGGTDQAQWPSLPARFLGIGIWEDVPSLLNALDVMVLSSFEEGFPNVVGEAMACAIPTIATQVGDAAYIVGDQGVIIPPNNPEALIQAIKSYLVHPPSKDRMRDRIVQNFGVSQMVDLTLQTLTEACVSS
jgi:glycosyltransferase involved in cell wall biosynthesis